MPPAGQGQETGEGRNLEPLFRELDEEMFRGAVALLVRHDRDPWTMRDEIVRAINEGAPAARREALADAKEAFAAGMDQAGVATARATMFLAGINAAKGILGVA